LVINTPIGKKAKYDDSYIRKAAVQHNIPYFTTLCEAKAAVEGIKSVKNQKISFRSIQII
jgi:carbamoyl-phosphate synthase large subunit